MVAILSGADLLNPRRKQEDMALKQQLRPPNYRLACKALIGPDSSQGGTIKVKLRPHTAAW